MRKHQQKQILELIQTMREAQKAGLYGDCQEGALACSNFIEDVTNKGAETIGLLRKYRELLFKIYNGEAEKEALKKALHQIELSVRKELKPCRIEVAFFPYKASMGDSLESIYLAAKADPDCDAYWVPIPYFDRKSDGSLGQMYYEGGEYPDYIEITDWQQYDIEARCPDIAFIHNPYDEFNYVTSVHPDYYSGALKKYVDFLVYADYGIPYRILKKPEESFDINKINKYPSRSNCDLIVCYSKEHANGVKLILSHYNTTKTLSKQYLNEKVAALGSAKFDKVINSKKEDFHIPDSWKEIIGDKKIMLYCTSISDLLNKNEKSLINISKRIDSFSKRDDIILWWRPHPLAGETLNCMRPELIKQYEEIVFEYKKNNIGIYDDTNNLNRAITWSDGCLTNLSSLSYLYLATGKPFSIVGRYNRGETLKDISDFRKILLHRIENMKSSKGANIFNNNICIWWENFTFFNKVDNERYRNSDMFFADFIVNIDKYPEADEYKQLQLQMFRDFVVNPDGTAGEKIYAYCKERIVK